MGLRIENKKKSCILVSKIKNRHVQDVLYMDTHAAPRVDGAYSSPPAGAHAAHCAQPAHPQPAPSRATAEASDALIRRLSGGEHGEGGGPSCHNYVQDYRMCHPHFESRAFISYQDYHMFLGHSRRPGAQPERHPVAERPGRRPRGAPKGLRALLFISSCPSPPPPRLGGEAAAPRALCSPPATRRLHATYDEPIMNHTSKKTKSFKKKSKLCIR